ncbi:MAG: hypothetical protein J6B75_01255 [Ruminococcus sp.]|nr:hypothetical protein [Ruminococcus sp.]
MLTEKIGNIMRNKKSAAAVAVLGTAGLLLIMLSSFSADKKEPVKSNEKPQTSAAQDYCSQTEERLEGFLEKIEGAGEVEVYLTVGSGERYVYVSEEKRSESENKTEEEEKYVLIGGSSSREPLIETVEVPKITGAVIVCTGCESPVVEERVYKAASAALGIPTADIYVTIMK